MTYMTSNEQFKGRLVAFEPRFTKLPRNEHPVRQFRDIGKI